MAAVVGLAAHQTTQAVAVALGYQVLEELVASIPQALQERITAAQDRPAPRLSTVFPFKEGAQVVALVPTTLVETPEPLHLLERVVVVEAVETYLLHTTAALGVLHGLLLAARLG